MAHQFPPPIPPHLRDHYVDQVTPTSPVFSDGMDRYSSDMNGVRHRPTFPDRDGCCGSFSSLKHYRLTHNRGRILHALAILFCCALGILLNFFILAGCTLQRFKHIWLLRVSTAEDQTKAAVYIGYFFLCFTTTDDTFTCANHLIHNARGFSPANESTATLGFQLAGTAFSPAMTVFSVVFFVLACFAAMSEVFHILREGEIVHGTRRARAIFWFFFLSAVFSAISCAAFWWGTRAAVNSRSVNDETILLTQGPLLTFLHVSVVLIALALAFMTSLGWWFGGFTRFMRSFHRS